jgi:hypothetical protein
MKNRLRSISSLEKWRDASFFVLALLWDSKSLTIGLEIETD